MLQVDMANQISEGGECGVAATPLALNQPCRLMVMAM